MVVCPKCGSNIQARKILVLTNHNAITCSYCRSKLTVENKGTNSAIGGVLGGVGGGLGTLFLIQLFRTGDFIFLGLFVALLVGLFVVAWVSVVKAVKLRVDLSGHDRPNMDKVAVN
jgi:DNA-directed RNA polymerase subunit RPC12/RpoP